MYLHNHSMSTVPGRQVLRECSLALWRHRLDGDLRHYLAPPLANSQQSFGNPGTGDDPVSGSDHSHLRSFFFLQLPSLYPVKPKSLALPFNLVPSTLQMENSCLASAGALNTNFGQIFLFVNGKIKSPRKEVPPASLHCGDPVGGTPPPRHLLQSWGTWNM